ncbi:hypothetical protein AC578_10787 [Pseudocercospora eumusae]|uniref:Uncharacterized protein n=1 Tax=Pseudocercospora eumusae TaxID=321146 RepID=A0A139H3Q7_9PEZI|nr:hypothetical protein AC578_10787 [Pseudocercospora eumusae]KXS97075.1 hypothetical protein AC578_10787 [Pseudocercospora eumusae]
MLSRAAGSVPKNTVSMYFGTASDPSTFGNKMAALFSAILICVSSAIAEVNALWEQRPIVEQHKFYVFYHPATEQIAGIVIDVLPKFLLAVFCRVFILRCRISLQGMQNILYSAFMVVAVFNNIT